MIAQKFKQQTRWLPNSAFQTYYGKPAFESYGMGNTNPTWGGLGYGQYMVSHNVNPHRSPNNPTIKQVTQSAELSKSKYDHIKEKYGRGDNYVPRKTKDEYQQSADEVNAAKEALSLAAVHRSTPWAKSRSRSNSAKVKASKDPVEESIEVKPFFKPDLMRTDVFASKDNTPRNSVDAESSQRGKKNVNIKEQLKKLNKETSLLRNKAAKDTKIKPPSERRPQQQNPKSALVQPSTGGAKQSETPKQAKKVEIVTDHKVEVAQASATIRQAAGTAAAGAKSAVRPQTAAPVTASAQEKLELYSGQRPPVARLLANQGPADEKDFRSEYQGAFYPEEQRSLHNLPKKGKGPLTVPPQYANVQNHHPIAIPNRTSYEAVALSQAPKVVSPLTQVENLSSSSHQPLGRQQQGTSSRVQALIGGPGSQPIPSGAYVPVIVDQEQDGFQRTEEIATSELQIDPFNPPVGYFSTLSQTELDPRNYKHVPSVWMNRIPYAGKALDRDSQKQPLLG